MDRSTCVKANDFFAHTPNKRGDWHLLEAHLKKVAHRAKSAADMFNAGEIAYWIGLWHDLGKYNPEFQRYLHLAEEGKTATSVPHAIGGAVLAYLLLKGTDKEAWKEIALPIAGHHAGLSQPGKLSQDLDEYWRSHPKLIDTLKKHAQALPTPPKLSLSNVDPYRRELFIRMVFSALIDADRLDTESHFDPGISLARNDAPTVEELWPIFERNQNELMRAAEENLTANQELLKIRREVYESCLKAAELPPGIFRLTVPTGGGKTRSGLAFALRHVLANSQTHLLRRIVVAIPYTSIIDQTAKEYREILGHYAVLEHHSQMPVRENENQDVPSLRLRLATENWDAPLIVTTTVQLLESLLSNHPSKIRKLHNLARSVILIDEVQTLPVELLTPTLDVLRSLVERYGVTLVLSSATQPAFEAVAGFKAKEIVTNYGDHFEKLRRVDYVRNPEPLHWREIAEMVGGEDQVLVVLNSRKDALALLKEFKNDEDLFHLSTLLCAAHRKAVLRLIKMRIKNKLPVRLISTQVIEAGVDVDFPQVWRAIGPLDRIVQAAGRCNREGKMPNRGKVVIFNPAEGRMPRGPYKAGFGLADFLINEHGTEKLHDPGLYREYFQRLYAENDLDTEQIQVLRAALDYPEVAKRYRLIKQDTVAAIVDYGKAADRVEQWKAHPSRSAWRRLQPYVVNLFQYEAKRLADDGWLDPLADGLYFWRGKYDRLRGLVEAVYDPADLISD